MSPKKVTELGQESELTPETQEAVEEISKKVAPKVELCGHVNKHFINIKHKLEDLYCDLPSGHTGEHQADYQHYQHCSPDEDGVLMIGGQPYIVVTDRAFWLDAAGTPSKDIPRDIESLREIRRIRSIEEEGKYI